MASWPCAQRRLVLVLKRDGDDYEHSRQSNIGHTRVHTLAAARATMIGTVGDVKQLAMTKVKTTDLTSPLEIP